MSVLKARSRVHALAHAHGIALVARFGSRATPPLALRQAMGEEMINAVKEAATK